MTTNSEGSQPNPGDQQQPDAAALAAAAAAAAGQQTPTEPAPVDIDQQDLDAAKAAAEAEKAAAAGDVTPPIEPGTPGQQQDQQQQPAGQQAPAGDAVMIPKPRFDEALTAKAKAEAEAAYWKGVADARAQGQQPAQPGQQQPAAPQQQQPTIEQRLATIQAGQDALAKKFDDGEITMSDLKRQERELNAREQALREEALLAKVRPAAASEAPKQGDELYLDTLTAQLEHEHPWVQVFDKVGTPIDWKYITDQAKQNLVDRGIDPTNGNIGKYELRKETAALMDRFGPAIVGDRAKAKGIAIPGQSQPSQDGQPQPKLMSPQAQARAAALTKQENAPPSLRAMTGTADDGSGVPTDSRLEHMSDDEIGALPESTRKKLLGTA